MSRSGLALVGDIGGTNARFALVDLASPTVELQASKSLPNAQFASLQHAIEHYLSGVDATPTRAARVISCPVTRIGARTTSSRR